MDNSPKLYMLKNAEGKYYNSRLNSWEKRLFLATFTTTKAKAQEVIDFYKLHAEVIIVTELEFTQDLASETTKTVIKLDSILTDLNKIHFHLPTISGLNKNISNFISKTSKYLKGINPHFEAFARAKEDQTFEVAAVYEEFIDELSNVELYHCGELTAILKAYHKDKKSILGIAKKILNN